LPDRSGNAFIYSTNRRLSAVQCPQCGKEIQNPNPDCRPFCSDRCKLVDLGKWISGDYRIVAEDAEENGKDDRPKPTNPEEE
jgi:endogenous inhibitor of DNA gyrase (YacG/DUF329 family)